MKSGANKVDQNDIRRLAASGVDAGEISLRLKIEESTVKNFMPKDTVSEETADPKVIAVQEMYTSGNEVVEIAEDLGLTVEEVEAIIEGME